VHDERAGPRLIGRKEDDPQKKPVATSKNCSKINIEKTGRENRRGGEERVLWTVNHYSLEKKEGKGESEHILTKKKASGPERGKERGSQLTFGG